MRSGPSRRGRELSPRHDAVWVTRGQCPACQRPWIGFASRRAYPGHESDLVDLPCPGCGAERAASLVLPSPGGVELWLADQLPWQRRRWLNQEREMNGQPPLLWSVKGLLVGGTLALTVVWFGHVLRNGAVLAGLVVTLPTWFGYFWAMQTPRWQAFRERRPVLGWSLQVLGGLAAMAVLPASVIGAGELGW